MEDNIEACIVMTTFADEDVGKRIINALLEKNLAACVQVMPIYSYYHWQGKVENDSEKLVFIKTLTSLYVQVEAEICRLHDYDVPEILQIPVGAGLGAYLGWMEESCSPKGE